MRTSLVLPAIVASVALAIAAANGCTLPLEGLPGAGGSGGRASMTSSGGAPSTGAETTSSSATASSATTSSTSTGGMECDAESQCPDDNACATYECNEGHCAQTVLNEGMTIPDPPTNCLKTVCLGGVLTTLPDEKDATDDNNPCTTDVCKEGSVTHPPAKDGTYCGDLNACRKGICCLGVVTSCKGVCCAIFQHCGTNGCTF